VYGEVVFVYSELFVSYAPYKEKKSSKLCGFDALSLWQLTGFELIIQHIQLTCKGGPSLARK